MEAWEAQTLTLPRRQKPILFDFVSMSLAVLAITLFVYASTFVGTTVAYQSLVAAFLLISGLTMAFLLARVRPDWHLDPKEWTSILMWTGVSMGAIFLVNLVRHLRFETTPMDPRLFSVLIGISEEVFFRVFLCAWLVLMVGEMFGIFLNASIFALYHVFVYSQQPSALLIIFGAGLILGYVFVKSRRASPVMLAHCLVNLIAVV